MAHEIEIINGKAQMAYAGDVPWHGLGTNVPADLTPAQMLEAAGLDWTVSKVPAYAEIAGQKIAIGQSALVRSSDDKMLDVVPDDWHPIQNEAAFEFFNDFVMAGDMAMETAGSLHEGKIVWGLAKVKDGFDLFKGKDVIESYLLFTNFHRFGSANDVRLTPTRVVCRNTLAVSLNQRVQNMVKITHRKKFDPDQVKVMLGIAHEKILKYKEMSEYLTTKRFDSNSLNSYFKKIFPTGSQKVMGNTDENSNDFSRNAKLALTVMDSQPGAELGEGTWWQPFNAVTYMTDHLMGRSADTRLTSAWYGGGKNLKIKALETAIEFADAA
jgi:phage/plasmid-like protein (TIGR03299 family)